MTRQRVAVVGSGVAGLTAGYLLQRAYDVTLFEADDRLGGHAHTRDVPTASGGTVALDSGFLVHNDRTYPHLVRLFAELGVATRDTDMSMSVRCDGCGLEYAGARGLGGLFPGLAILGRPAYLRLLATVVRFHRDARRVLAAPAGVETTLGEFLAAGHYGRYFTSHFLVPVVSAVWSCSPAQALDYPARYLFTFLSHHGMLSITGSPTWRTVVGGSRTYVERAAKHLTAVHTTTPVRALRRTGGGVELRDDADTLHRFDRVVVATHPDQALALLADPTPAEASVLGAFRYTSSDVALHTDGSLLPRAPRARASWNVLLPDCHATPDRVQVSYHLNRLQGVGGDTDYLVTLNATDRLQPGALLEQMTYAHPIYTPASVAAQARLPELNTGVTAYAGAYHGWGFHEDGCRSGVAAAASFGVAW